MLFVLPIFALSLSISKIITKSIICSPELYGRPSASDSATVARALPFVKDDPDDELSAGRIFAEPGVFRPRFSALENKWETKMVQLPMIWRFSRWSIGF